MISKISVTLISAETIEALNDNIREVIAEIRLHTIDVLKNWTDRVGLIIVLLCKELVHPTAIHSIKRRRSLAGSVLV